jgi:hypothetical protein
VCVASQRPCSRLLLCWQLMLSWLHAAGPWAASPPALGLCGPLLLEHAPAESHTKGRAHTPLNIMLTQSVIHSRAHDDENLPCSMVLHCLLTYLHGSENRAPTVEANRLKGQLHNTVRVENGWHSWLLAGHPTKAGVDVYIGHTRPGVVSPIKSGPGQPCSHQCFDQGAHSLVVQ